MWKVLVLLVSALMLSACDRAPDSTQLRQDVTQALNDTFGEATFEVTNLIRRGTAVDSTAPQGETRRVVYYDISLTLKKDMELGAWDQPGAAALVSLLGAGPRSIRGIKSGGNRANDQITAHASASYRQEGDRWLFVAPVGFAAVEAPVLDLETNRPPMERLRSSLDEMARSLPFNDTDTARKVVGEELDRSFSRIQARLARLQQGFALAGGPEKGEYLTFSQALSSIAAGRKVRMTPLVTEGGAENIALLRSGDVVIGLAQADVALLAYQGKGPFAAEGPFDELRALGSLYPELMHVIVREDSGIDSIRALQGKRVSLGAEGSGGGATLKEVLAAHGLVAGENYEALNIPLTTALQQLSEGKLDAVVQVIGIPSGALRSAIPLAHLKLLPLEPEAVKKMVQQNPALMALDIPKGTYPDQTAPVPTLGTAALLLTTSKLTPDEAAMIVKTVFQAEQDILAAGSVQGAQLSAETARQGVTIPLHSGVIGALQKLKAQRSAPASP